MTSQGAAERADESLMTAGRGFGLVTLVASLVVGAMLFAAQWGGTSGAPRPRELRKSGPVAAANSVAAAAAAQRAADELAFYHDEHDTYAGAVVDVAGVQVVRADETSYCLLVQQG